MSWNPQPRSALSSLETFYKLGVVTITIQLKDILNFAQTKD